MRTAFLKRIVLCLAVFIAFVIPLPASVGAQEVIPLASSVYEDMDLLYLLAGEGTPSGSRPWTKAEAQAILGRVQKEGLQAAALSLYESIEERVDAALRWNFSDGFSLSAYADISVESYVHLNSDFSSYGAWDYSYVDRKPLLRLRLDMAVSDFFYTYSDLQYGYGLHTKDDSLDYLGADESVGALIPKDSKLYYVDENTTLVQYQKRYANNLISSSTHIDFQTPKRSVISLGGPRWNATFSRDRISWGNSKIGNFVLDDHVDFHEYLRFTTYSEYFKYEALAVFFDMNCVGSSKLRMLLAHRLEFRPWGKVSVAVSENVMYQDDTLDLRFLNPAFVYHNLNQREKFNAIAHIELAYVPVAGFRLYGQFALDQAVAPNEGDNPELPAWGLSLGADYATVLAQGVWQSSIEASLALPHMYRRDTVDFLMARRYAGLNNTAWNAIKLDYIGSPYGGDAFVLHAQTLYKVADRGSLSLAVTGVLKGDIGMFTELDDRSSGYGTTMFSEDVIHTSFIATLAGALDVGNLISFSTDWQVYSQVSLLARGSYLQSLQAFNSHAWDVQLVMGTSFSF
jgi:hypothetical protein